MHYLPLALPFMLALLFLVTIWLVSIEIGVLEYAYVKMGVHPRYIYFLLLASLFGSYINIPIADVPTQPVPLPPSVTYFGMRHMIARMPPSGHTIIAINVGGALVPAILSAYLTIRHRLGLRALVGVLVVAGVVHTMATPVQGLGISVPVFVPPLVAAATAMLLSRRLAAPLAYVSGTVGTLIGADLLNIDKVQALGAPIASIGGAGTFDGVFLTGLLAVLLA